jgi:cyclopropane fatty-acyl-phospholipid synthase-like methyltransferase
VYGSFFGAQNPVSTQWAYDAILQKIPAGSSILDIGCGDGIYFQNASAIATIKEKKFKIFAIDIDAGAVEICKQRIKDAGLDDAVSAKAVDVTEITDKYDYVLWMESFPVIPRSIFPPLFKHRYRNPNAFIRHPS